MAKYFIAWNEAHNEGFITDAACDVYTAQTGRKHPDGRSIGLSTAALAFYDAYKDDTITIEEVDLPAALEAAE